MNLQFKKLKVDSKPGKNSVMSVLELQNYIDFDVKRVYYTTNIQGDTSQHAHRIEKELFVMIQGSCIATIDKGDGLEEIKIESPSDAIYVGNYIWHGFKDFSPGSVLMALSSTNYSPDRSDYIEDYSKYEEKVKN